MELNTLYIRVQITKKNLATFFLAKPSPEEPDENWREWWHSREMYSKTALETIPAYAKQSYRDVVDELLHDRFFAAAEHYDEDKQCWTFMALNFSENYHEILPMLAFIKQLAKFSEEGHALIYNWMWGGESVMAFVQIQYGQALLHPFTKSAQIAPDILADIDNYLQVVADNRYSKQSD
ncbi:hypothetical protein AAW12_24280 [Sphingobacterium sp. Ag1]|uniref:hypothetical protein n=1 Tax=Sphingobacterium sp. Ag1 TaxID=1643451 RepID=UPI000628030D|nr:hypothetical protein [Sphingobacterium sp. Ag1]KKO89231.1 hypothetical protein AAW12_24280 [Sphingobacterium sp. Ag1]